MGLYITIIVNNSILNYYLSDSFDIPTQALKNFYSIVIQPIKT